MKVLYVGCGPNGGLIGFENCDKHGIDHLCDEYVKIGYPLHEHNIKYVNGKSESLPYDSDFFDAVVCVNALDHVDSLDASVGQISRVLKKGGQFLAQLNFRTKPTVCEPIVFDHNSLKTLFENHSMRIEEVKFQYSQSKSEDRYYYKVRKV
jgi:ubiquinone/menaquinone biosynthesis C-methylase UbiE